MFFNRINDLADLADHLLNDTKSSYDSTKEEYQALKKASLIGTLLLAALCIGIMYIRFRVFGG